MTLDEQLEIIQAAKRGEVDHQRGELPGWWRVGKEHKFNFEENTYRIADPYAELKAAAKDPTKQIRFGQGEWVSGYEKLWHHNWEFDQPLHCYEIRDKPKPKKVVKYLCWEDIGYLQWRAEGFPIPQHWIRRPAFDKECEVEDE